MLFNIAAVKAVAVDVHYAKLAKKIERDTISRTNGKTTTLTIYNGEKVVEVIRLRDGKRNGIHELFNGDGSLKKQAAYKNGNLHGKTIIYNYRGQIIEEKTYKYNKARGHSLLQGKYEKYYNTRLIFSANYKDSLLHGKTLEYANNNLKSIKHYKRGKLSGNAKRYNYANGLLISDENYKIIKDSISEKSVLHGKCIYYSSNGGINNIGNYKNGNKDGVWKTYYHNTPNIESEINYKDGLKYGAFTKYYSNGNIKNEGFTFEELLSNKRKKTKLDGEQKDYYENGILSKLSHYNMGVKTGIWETYYNNAKLKTIGEYSDNLLIGNSLYYGLDGDTISYVTYKLISQNNKLASVKDGTERRWKNGAKVFEQTYKDGKKHGKGISYYGNGQPSNLMNFNEGYLEGEYVDYYQDGQTKSYRVYRIDTNIRSQIKSKIIGWEYRYDKDGSLNFKNYRGKNESSLYSINFTKGKINKIQYGNGMTLNYFPEGKLMSIIINNRYSQPIFAQYFYRNGQMRIISFQNGDKGVINQIIYTSNGDLMTTTNYTNQNPDSLNPSPSTIANFGEAVGLHYIDNKFYTDTLRNGSYSLFYGSGKPMCNLQLKNELLDGEFVLFDALNGDTLKYANYNKGLQYGAFLEKFAGITTVQKGEFYDNGQKKSTEQYSSKGLATLKETFDEKGKRVEYYTFHTNGKIKNYTNYLSGANVSYDANGNILNETINKGNISVRNRYYALKRQISSSNIYIDNKKDSIWKTYYPTGILKSTIRYHKNQKNGKYIYYNEEGNIKNEGNYKNNIADGAWVKHFEGTTDTTFYKNGRAVVKQNLAQCECVDTTLHKIGFANSLNRLLDYYTLVNNMPSYIQSLDSNAYKSIFYSGLFTGSGSYSLTMLMYKKLSFELPADKQLRLTINPCHTKGYVSKVRASAYIDPRSPHKRMTINPKRIAIEFIKGPMQSDDLRHKFFTASFNMESIRFISDEKPHVYMAKEIDPCFTKAVIKNYLHLQVNDASLTIFKTPYSNYSYIKSKELDNFFGIQINDADIEFNYNKFGENHTLKAKCSNMLAGGNFASGRITLECTKKGVDKFEVKTEDGLLQFSSQDLKVEWLKRGFTHLNFFYSEEINALVIDFYAK